MSEWENSEQQEMVTVAISLTGGVDIGSECKVYVSDNNCDLVVMEKMVDLLSNVELLHKHWLSGKDKNTFVPNSPVLTGFHKYFASIRKREDEDIFMTAIIPLPFPVEKHIVDLYRLGNEKGARVLYVVLRAMNSSDYKVAGTKND